MVLSTKRSPARSGASAIFLLITTGLLALLGGCASHGPRPAAPSQVLGTSERDGPDAVIPPDLKLTPDAQPRVEAIRKGGPNKPYEALGQRYEPLTEDLPLVERGLASWYGRKFHGRPTSSGEVYNMYAMTAAHATMPIPSYARVRNPANGREVIVRVNDRGPFHPGRVVDLSYTAALKLDLLRGVAPVEVERITFEDIRTGAWQRGRNGGPSPVNEPAYEPVYAVAEASAAPAGTSVIQLREPSASALATSAAPMPALPSAASSQTGPGSTGFWVQLGAFGQLDGAESLRQRLVKRVEGITPLLAIFKEKSLHRLQAGPYPTRDEARLAADKLGQLLALSPMVVERR